MTWWEARRFRYNKGLVIAGVLAFIAFEIVGEYVVWPRDHEFEITLFTMAFQGAGYLCLTNSYGSRYAARAWRMWLQPWAYTHGY